MMIFVFCEKKKTYLIGWCGVWGGGGGVCQNTCSCTDTQDIISKIFLRDSNYLRDSNFH